MMMMMMMTLPRMLERPPWDLQQLCEAYQYRHDRQASALHDAMDNQVSFSSSHDRTRKTHLSKYLKYLFVVAARRSRRCPCT